MVYGVNKLQRKKIISSMAFKMIENDKGYIHIDDCIRDERVPSLLASISQNKWSSIIRNKNNSNKYK